MAWLPYEPLGRLGSEEVESPLLSLRRPSFSRWPEQSVLGQQTLVSGRHEFSLKTTALKPHARDTWEQNCSYNGSV